MIILDALVDFLVSNSQESDHVIIDFRSCNPAMAAVAIAYSAGIVYLFADGTVTLACAGISRFRGTLEDPGSLDALLASINEYGIAHDRYRDLG